MHCRAMFSLLLSLFDTLHSDLRTRAELALENLALRRRQLATLRRSTPRPRLRLADRVFWIGLSRIWSRWSDALVIVKPDTVVRWRRAGFRLFWQWKSLARTFAEGEVSREVKALIRKMAKTNGWGAPGVHGELLKLGARPDWRRTQTVSLRTWTVELCAARDCGYEPARMASLV
jgi:hypothetical protein